MKIVVAPDSYKGSLTALEAARAIEAGIRSADPAADIVVLPIADGGEGTLDAVLTAANGERVTVDVTGPLGEPTPAAFGVLTGNPVRCFIEMAQAAGLGLVSVGQRDPRRTTTFGVGELILAALNFHPEEIVIGLGGSCTNDGGAGAISALGVRFFDKNQKPLPLHTSGGDLAALHQFDISRLAPELKAIKITLASDVASPLVGPLGASAVYGPQKGATLKQVIELDKALTNFAAVVQGELGVDISSRTGGGAAGGLGAGLMAFLNAGMRSGIDLVLDIVDFDQCAEGADFVFTGEGRIDSQTERGKAVSGVLARSKRLRVPVIAFGGTVHPEAELALRKIGLHSAVPIKTETMTTEEAIRNASELLTAAVTRTMRDLLLT
jgi:glycerate 2-kinase